jgi:hypothetical protein
MFLELVDGHVHQTVVIVGQRKDVADERTLDSENVSDKERQIKILTHNGETINQFKT